MEGFSLKEEVQSAMRKIPSMDKLLVFPWVAVYESEIGRDAVKATITEVLDVYRKKIKANHDIAFDEEIVVRDVKKLLDLKSTSSFKKVINATGVIIHTNLGRSLLADEAIKAVNDIATCYNTLEYSVQEGTRGRRGDHVEWLLCRLTGAEAAIVVNNNAGAVVLALGALAKNKETIVSRGELVEIGGSFRIPDIMALSDTKLIEVGATNRTHLKDYSSAITNNTALLLKVHPSNYRIAGFTSVVPREELSALAHKHGIIFMEDVGSGMLIDTKEAGLTDEPTVRECLEAGSDLVTFSGDKLLGGPQIGAIVGSAEVIDKLRTYPLLRALRVDKMTLAAFEATLRLYLKGSYESIPTISMIFKKPEDLKKQAECFLNQLKSYFDSTKLRSVTAEVVNTIDTVGGGAFPLSELKGYAVAVRLPELGSTGKLLEMLRNASTPIITGASDDKILFHMRTLRPGDEEIIVKAFNEFLTIQPTHGE